MQSIESYLRIRVQQYTSVTTVTNVTSECLVEGTENMMYDCCTSTSQIMCIAFSVVDYLTAIGFIVLLILAYRKYEWIREQSLIIYVIFFQIILFLARATYYAAFGYTETGMATYFVFKTAPTLSLFLSITAYLFYMFYLRKRFSPQVTEEQQINYKMYCHVFYITFAILLIILWVFLIIVSTRQNSLQQILKLTLLLFRFLVNVTLTSLYGLYFILFIYLFLDFYQILRINQSLLAKHTKSLIFWTLLVVELEIFTRMIFISVIDVAQIINATDTYAWPGFLLGQSVSELLSACLMITAVYLTYKVELISKAYFLHSQEYQRVKTADLQASMDIIFENIKHLELELKGFFDYHNKFQTRLRNLDYSYMEDIVKQPVTSFEDQLYQSINRVKDMQDRYEQIRADAQQLSKIVDRADTQSIQMMDKLKKDLDKMLHQIKQEGDSSFSQEKIEFIEIEKTWDDIQHIIKKEDEKIVGICKHNFEAVQVALGPTKEILMQLDQIYKRISLNPYVQQLYFDKLKEQIKRDLIVINSIQADLLHKYKNSLSALTPSQMRRVNKQCVEAKDTLDKIERRELSNLQDCNILFQFESKAAEIKAQLIEVEIKVNGEINKLKETLDNPQMQHYQTMYLELQFNIKSHDIYELEKEYHQITQNKKLSITFETAFQYVQQYELIMMKTVKSQEKVHEFINAIRNIEIQIGKNEDKQSIYNQVKHNLHIFEVFMNNYAGKDLTDLADIIKDSEHINLEELKSTHTIFHQRFIQDVQHRFIKLQQAAMSYKHVTIEQLQNIDKELKKLEEFTRKAYQKFIDDIVKCQKNIGQYIGQLRMKLDLKALKELLNKLEPQKEENQSLMKQYDELVETSQLIVLKEIPPVNPQNPIANQRDLLNLLQRMLDLRRMFDKIRTTAQTIYEYEEKVRKHLQLFHQITDIVQQWSNFSEKMFEVGNQIFGEEGEQLLQKMQNLRDSIQSLEGYSEFNNQELKKKGQEVSEMMDEMKQFIESRITGYMTNLIIEDIQPYKFAFDTELLKDCVFKNAEFNNQKDAEIQKKLELESEIQEPYQQYLELLPKIEELKQQILESLQDQDSIVQKLQEFFETLENLENAMKIIVDKNIALQENEKNLEQYFIAMTSLKNLESVKESTTEKLEQFKQKIEEEKKVFIDQVEEKINVVTTQLNEISPEESKEQIIEEKQVKLIEKKNNYMKQKELIEKQLKIEAVEEIQNLIQEIQDKLESENVEEVNDFEKGIGEKVEEAINKCELQINEAIQKTQNDINQEEVLPEVIENKNIEIQENEQQNEGEENNDQNNQEEMKDQQNNDFAIIEEIQQEEQNVIEEEKEQEIIIQSENNNPENDDLQNNQQENIDAQNINNQSENELLQNNEQENSQVVNDDQVVEEQK